MTGDGYILRHVPLNDEARFAVKLSDADCASLAPITLVIDGNDGFRYQGYLKPGAAEKLARALLEAAALIPEVVEQ